MLKTFLAVGENKAESCTLAKKAKNNAQSRVKAERAVVKKRMDKGVCFLRNCGAVSVGSTKN